MNVLRTAFEYCSDTVVGSLYPRIRRCLKNQLVQWVLKPIVLHAETRVPQDMCGVSWNPRVVGTCSEWCSPILNICEQPEQREIKKIHEYPGEVRRSRKGERDSNHTVQGQMVEPLSSPGGSQDCRSRGSKLFRGGGQLCQLSMLCTK